MTHEEAIAEAKNKFKKFHKDKKIVDVYAHNQFVIVYAYDKINHIAFRYVYYIDDVILSFVNVDLL